MVFFLIMLPEHLYFQCTVSACVNYVLEVLRGTRRYSVYGPSLPI